MSELRVSLAQLEVGALIAHWVVSGMSIGGPNSLAPRVDEPLALVGASPPSAAAYSRRLTAINRPDITPPKNRAEVERGSAEDVIRGAYFYAVKASSGSVKNQVPTGGMVCQTAKSGSNFGRQ